MEEGKKGHGGAHEVRQIQCLSGTLESEPLPGIVLGIPEGGHCQALLAAGFPVTTYLWADLLYGYV